MKTNFEFLLVFLSVLVIMSCKKEKELPPLTNTESATEITNVTVTLNGTVTANYLSTNVVFEYGLTTSYGQAVEAVQSPVNGSKSTAVNATVSGLTSGVTYFYRIKAINSKGTVFGEEKEFTTTVEDNDGNVYAFVTIGTQIWMVENLKTTKYRNGDFIGTTIPATLNISEENTPKYFWSYNGNESNTTIYGNLYTWYAATDNRNICPSGWHLPNDIEWSTLTTYLGGESVAGRKLKESGTNHWAQPNTNATNEAGFTALPSGYRGLNNAFVEIGYYGNWWSSTEYTSESGAWFRYVLNGYNGVIRQFGNRNFGFSVRCIRDN